MSQPNEPNPWSREAATPWRSSTPPPEATGSPQPNPSQQANPQPQGQPQPHPGPQPQNPFAQTPQNAAPPQPPNPYAQHLQQGPVPTQPQQPPQAFPQQPFPQGRSTRPARAAGPYPEHSLTQQPVPAQPPNAPQQPFVAAPPNPAQPFNAAPQPFVSAQRASAPQSGGATAAPGAPARRNYTPWVLGALAAIVVIGLLTQFIRGRGNDAVPVTTASSSPSASSTVDAAHATQDAAVKTFLTHYAAGNGTAALKDLYSPPDNPEFLTDAALKKALAASPITNIQVTPPSSAYSTSVQASWTMGGKTYSDDFIIRGDETAGYRVDPGSSLVTFYSLDEGMDITLNDIPVTGQSAQLLPGTYQVKSTNALLAVQPATMTVTDFSTAKDAGVKTALSQDGTKKVRAAMKTKLTACLDGDKLYNPDCGIELRSTAQDGTPVDPKYLRCSVSKGKDALDKAAITHDWGMSFRSEFDMTLYCKARSLKKEPLEVDIDLTSAQIDLTEGIAVTFQ